MLLTAFTVVAVLVGAQSAPAGSAPPPGRGQVVDAKDGAAQVYVVQMADEPVIAYEGGEPGLAATAPAPGRHANPNSANVRRYRAHLDRAHAAALAAAGAPADAKFYDYNFSFNGFAAELTPAQAARLAQNPEVVAVSVDAERHPMTDNTPSDLGLSTPGGFWDTAGVGEDVIIGVIDTGIWPEHPSFSDQSDFAHRQGSAGNRLRAYGPPPAHWNGICQAGEQFSRQTCNNKLIGARYFIEGLRRSGVDPADYASARDRDGHGTHTASTAGGNRGVDPSIFGRDLGVDTISGMAPRARIAAYKGCFGEAGCVVSDLVMAIDTAVADGVDVINYSIGSNTPSVVSPDAIAFLFARRAGVFVATSAGNAGPGASTVGSPASAPWVTAVGASTHSRTFDNEVVLGDGAVSVTGGSVTPGVGPARLVNAGAECPDGLDPAEVAGAIVFCQRVTGIARVNHGAAVRAAGGVGMILFDPPQVNVTPTDNHVLPTSTVLAPAAGIILDYIEAQGAAATATITAGTSAVNPDAPDMAVFSSRGPNGAAPDIIKPDVTAPGVEILAGAAPNPWLGAPGQLFQAIQGTSMSSPHVAGVGALLSGTHPDWSPAMISSALVTTAHQDVDKQDFVTAADPFDFGGGHIQPFPANDPGLVYDADFADYVDFLCGSGEINCPPARAVDPSDLNQPTIGIGQLAGVQTVTRELTNVGPAGTYTVAVEAPPGVTAVVTPPTLTFTAAGTPDAVRSYTVTFTVADTAGDEWRFGSLTWSDGAGHSVRSPIAVRPVPLSAPVEITGEGVSGSETYEVTFGYTGPFSATPRGLVPADVSAGRTVVDDPADDINVALGTGVGIDVIEFEVPAGTRHYRASLFDENTDGADDLDLYLFQGSFDDPDNLVFLDGSGSVTSAEQVDAEFPSAGTYTLVVHGWETDGPEAVYDLFTWMLGNTAAGNMTVTAPTAATVGQQGTIDVAWTGLALASKYLGAVVYSDLTDELGQTLVNVTT
ncbi:MAG: S8 family serine peptidase [Acidimicrobiia bacterium]|nr:S8 family serine peptidase [Acidimicrobiia bacterium]